MLPAHYNKKETSYFCRFTFGQFFTLLVLEIFTLFFVFYLGSRYGRELFGVETAEGVQPERGLPEVTTTDPEHVATTSDPEIRALARDILETAPASDLKEKVEEMLNSEGGRDEARSRKHEAGSMKQEARSRKHEAGSMKQEARSTKREAGSMKQEARSRKHEAGSMKQEAGSMKQEARSTKHEAGSMKQEARGTNPVIATAPANAKYSIQVGSYPNSDEAHDVVNAWKEKGYEAYLLSADIPEKGRWYRVRLGAFQTKEEAQNYLTEFKTKEGVEAFIASNF